MKRVRITRRIRYPIFGKLAVIADNIELCRLKSGQSAVIEIPENAELLQISSDGVVSTPHELSQIPDGAHLEIIADKDRPFGLSEFIAPFDFRYAASSD